MVVWQATLRKEVAAGLGLDRGVLLNVLMRQHALRGLETPWWGPSSPLWVPACTSKDMLSGSSDQYSS